MNTIAYFQFCQRQMGKCFSGYSHRRQQSLSKRTVISLKYLSLTVDFEKKRHIHRSVFQRCMYMCKYQCLHVDLFLCISIYVHICWSRPVVHAVITIACQDTEYSDSPPAQGDVHAGHGHQIAAPLKVGSDEPEVLDRLASKY